MAVLTRKEQRARTREALLDATIACLVEYGYAGTTTQRIQEKVGVSRGALLHHFGSKAELFVAAIHHISDKRLLTFPKVGKRAPVGAETLRRLIYEIADDMTGPPFQAAMQLWIAARTDEELREALLPAERRLGSAMREIFDKYSGIEDPHAARVAFESLMAMLRGLEVTRAMRKDEKLAREVVDHWVATALPPVGEAVPGDVRS
ncbi:TetR/AcrR family transcriptional regulator [Saccharomonospora sp. NPDC046836]|uniref:TetR/AcrR family transcriptional regulator n=1 Tax=Saccharomonospora sp. NPDC046836 TaxID=3156921 RepID=UPI003409B5B4